MAEAGAERTDKTMATVERNHIGVIREYSAFVVVLLVIGDAAFIHKLDPVCRITAEALASLRVIVPEEIELYSVLVNLLTSSALVLLIVHFWEKKPARSIGLRKLSVDDFVLSIGAWLLEYSINDAVFPYYHPGIPLTAALTAPPALATQVRRVVTFIAADVLFEELAPRAYLIERVSRFTGSVWLAGTASFALSFAMHLPTHGLAYTMSLTPLFLTLTVLYVWQRTLAACVLAHFLMDTSTQFLVTYAPVSVVIWFFSSHHQFILLLGCSLLYWSIRRLRRRAADLPPAAAS